MEFRYRLPVNLVFGRGRANDIGKEAAHYGTKALIVTGGSSAKCSGLLDRVQTELEQAGIRWLRGYAPAVSLRNWSADKPVRTGHHGGGYSVDDGKLLQSLGGKHRQSPHAGWPGCR